MIRVLIAWCMLVSVAAADDPVKDLLNEAESLARSKRNVEAMDKVEAAIVLVDRKVAAGESISWSGMNGFRFAAKLAREAFLDYKKALAFSEKQLRYTDNDYWRVPARLEMAMTYRAMRDFKKAQQMYDTIAATDERYQANMAMPQAEMVYFDMSDEEKGRELLESALQNADINPRERFGTIRKCATQAMTDGRREVALRWYALTEKMPIEKVEERARFLSQALYEMGRIEECRGRAAEAKSLYHKAMELEDGEMRYRARARDALESIEYFE